MYEITYSEDAITRPDYQDEIWDFDRGADY